MISIQLIKEVPSNSWWVEMMKMFSYLNLEKSFRYIAGMKKPIYQILYFAKKVLSEQSSYVILILL